MIIDVYCHIYPRKLLKALAPYLANAKTKEANYFNNFLMNEEGPDKANFSDGDARIRYMDKFGIDVEAVNFQLPNFFETEIPPTDLIKTTRFANDCVAEIVERYPERMVGVAVIPTLEGEYLDELDRAFGELGMKGCLIYTNIYGKPLDSPEFLGFYSKMVKYDLPVFLHPSNWRYYPWIWNYRLSLMLGWPFDTSLALSSLVFGGITERFPNIKIVSHHLDGMVPYFVERIKGYYDEILMHPNIYGRDVFPYADKMKEHPIEHFKRFYADTATSGSLAALRCGYDFAGQDRVVFGTDFPYGPELGERWTRQIMQNIRDIDIPPEAKSKIWEGNARKLLKLA